MSVEMSVVAIMMTMSTVSRTMIVSMLGASQPSVFNHYHLGATRSRHGDQVVAMN